MIKPLGPRVLVKRINDEETRSNGGIVIPPKPGDEIRLEKGLVLDCGGPLFKMDGKVDDRGIDVGDVIRYHKSSGVEIDPEHVIVDKINIVGKE